MVTCQIILRTLNDDVLEDLRCILVNEMKKKGKDMELRQKMEVTFSLRRLCRWSPWSWKFRKDGQVSSFKNRQDIPL